MRAASFSRKSVFIIPFPKDPDLDLPINLLGSRSYILQLCQSLTNAWTLTKGNVMIGVKLTVLILNKIYELVACKFF